MRYRFQSLAPQPGMTELDLDEAAASLSLKLARDPVLKQPKVAAIARYGAIGLWAFVHSEDSQLAVYCAMTAADDQWAIALRFFGYEDDDRTARLTKA